MNKVEERFINRAIKRGNTLYFTRLNAMQFVKACEKENVIILGIDAFYLTDTTTQPTMENSIDYTRSSPEKFRYEDAFKFLQEKDDSFYFEIVCGE